MCLFRLILTHNSADRVQWFRSEAEMLRWLEQREIKYCEFVRLLQTFRHSKVLWESIETKSTTPGRRAHAAQMAMDYSTLLHSAIKRFRDVVRHDIIGDQKVEDITHGSMIEHLLRWRRQFLTSMYSHLQPHSTE